MDNPLDLVNQNQAQPKPEGQTDATQTVQEVQEVQQVQEVKVPVDAPKPRKQPRLVKKVFVIEYDADELGEDWMNEDNLDTVIANCCPNTDFDVTEVEHKQE